MESLDKEEFDKYKDLVIKQEEIINQLHSGLFFYISYLEFINEFF